MHETFTVCFADLGKLNLTIVVRFKKNKTIFATAPAASKNEARFKIDSKQMAC